ncbi:MAG TPA: nuclear transport factor 2 family protein [Vicinamibacterales bacterium]|nr:nuclear transport factor 2 family protein [Vicinamibacterales bacterium]
MNRRRFLAGVVLLSSVVAGVWVPAFAQSAEQDVRKAERDRFAAMLKNDVAALDRLLAPELIYTHGDGRVVDKAAFIADLKTGDFKYVTIDAGEPTVRVFGDAAIVNGTAGMSVVNKGAPAKIRIVYSTTQVRRNGSWQMVSWHATRLAQ